MRERAIASRRVDLSLSSKWVRGGGMAIAQRDAQNVVQTRRDRLAAYRAERDADARSRT